MAVSSNAGSRALLRQSPLKPVKGIFRILNTQPTLPGLRFDAHEGGFKNFAVLQLNKLLVMKEEAGSALGTEWNTNSFLRTLTQIQKYLRV